MFFLQPSLKFSTGHVWKTVYISECTSDIPTIGSIHEGRGYFRCLFQDGSEWGQCCHGDWWEHLKLRSVSPLCTRYWCTVPNAAEWMGRWLKMSNKQASRGAEVLTHLWSFISGNVGVNTDYTVYTFLLEYTCPQKLIEVIECPFWVSHSRPHTKASFE